MRAEDRLRARERHIGPVGTAVRVVLGTALVAFGALGGRFVFAGGRPDLRFDVPALVVGLVVYPAVLIVWQGVRSRRDPSRLEETGSTAAFVNILVLGLLAGTAGVRAISFLGFAAFIFYGASMLLAAVRGYAGCEVLAVSNWLLRRDDQIGCLVLSPIDRLEHQARDSRHSVSS